MELLPFNLEEALKNPDRVVYRNGEKPLEWHWFEKCKEIFNIISVTSGGNNRSHLSNGKWRNGCDECDLLLLPLPVYWANVYKTSRGIEIGEAFESEEEAKKAVIFIDSYAKTISFTL